MMVYLMLLLAIEERDPTRVGSELELAAAVVAIFVAVMAGTWLYLKIQARRSR